MNVFALPADGGGYVFGNSWGTVDLNASFAAGPTLPLTLAPNTSISRDVPLTDTFWWKPDGSPNKNMDAAMYVQDDTLAGSVVTFTGLGLANTLVSPYTCTVFIKDFVPNYSSFTTTTTPLVPDVFNISLATTAGDHVQYGFETIGPNARNEAGQAALPSNAQVTAIPEPSSIGLALAGRLGFVAFLRKRCA